MKAWHIEALVLAILIGLANLSIAADVGSLPHDVAVFCAVLVANAILHSIWKEYFR